MCEFYAYLQFSIGTMPRKVNAGVDYYQDYDDFEDYDYDYELEENG